MRITHLTLLIERLLTTLPDEEEDDNRGVFLEEEQTLALIAELRGELFEIDLEALRMNDATYREFVGSLYGLMNVYLNLAEEIFESRPRKTVEIRFQKKFEEGKRTA